MVDSIFIPDIFRSRIALFHIEKTGGTAITRILSRYFNASEQCPERGAGFRFWRRAKLNQYRFFSAHTEITDFEAIPGEYKSIVVLRDPIDRALSYYEFLRYQSDGLNNPDPRVRVAMELSVDEFFFEAPKATLESVNNYMVQRLCSDRWPMTQDSLEKAKLALNRFTYVGVTERLFDLLDRLSDELGIAPVPYSLGTSANLMNATAAMLSPQNPMKIGAVGAATIARIRDLNQLDIKLYDYAVEQFCGGFPLKSSVVMCSVQPALHTTAGPDATQLVVVAPEYVGNVLYGPYRRVLPGRWTVAFHIALLERVEGSDEVSFEIDVYSAVHGGVVASRKLLATEFDCAGFGTFEINLTLEAALPDVEFRLFKFGKGRILCRQDIALTRLGDCVSSAP